MFRKTFIRLILSIVVASVALIAYSSSRSANTPEKESCDTEETALPTHKGELLLLETLTRTLFTKTGN